MYLIYTDESGTDINSKFLLYGGIFVHERKANSLENKIAKIFSDTFGNDIPEIHFSDVYNYVFLKREPSSKNKKSAFQEHVKPYLEKITKDDIYSFIDELSECLWSNGIQLIFSICPKEKFKKIHKHYKEYLILGYKSFLYSSNVFLSSKNENGILISDIADKNQNQLFEKILRNVSNWKKLFNSKDTEIEEIMNSISKTDIYNDHIIENICFVDSKTSKLNQVADILLYIFKKIIEIKNSTKNTSKLEEILSNLEGSVKSLWLANTNFCEIDKNKNNKYEFMFVKQIYSEKISNHFVF